MPRFVLLYHQLPKDHERDSHWDLMLEGGDHLLTWALDKSPTEFRSGEALQLPNHRLAYLTKEGDVSGGRGTVRRVDAGTFDWALRESDAITVELAGSQVRGTLELQRQSATAWKWKRDVPQ